jgi:transposase
VVKHLFADAAYDRLQLMDKATYLRFVIEIIRRSDGQKGFEVLPRRWVAERTFGWMIRWRRLVRDQKDAPDCMGTPPMQGRDRPTENTQRGNHHLVT